MSYTEPHGCHDCKCCFVHSQQDEATSFYCNYTKTLPKFKPPTYDVKRPINKRKENLLIKRIDEWIDWTKCHEVQPWGTCEKRIITQAAWQKILNNKQQLQRDK